MSAWHFFISSSVENMQLMSSVKHPFFFFFKPDVRRAERQWQIQNLINIVLFPRPRAFCLLFPTSATNGVAIIWISLSLLGLDWLLENCPPPYAEQVGVLLENMLSAPVVKHGDNGNKHARGWIKVAQETFWLVSALLWTQTILYLQCKNKFCHTCWQGHCSCMSVALKCSRQKHSLSSGLTTLVGSRRKLFL